MKNKDLKIVFFYRGPLKLRSLVCVCERFFSTFFVASSSRPRPDLTSPPLSDHSSSTRSCWCSLRTTGSDARVTISVSLSPFNRLLVLLALSDTKPIEASLLIPSVPSPPLFSVSLFPLFSFPPWLLVPSSVFSASAPFVRASSPLPLCRLYFLPSQEKWNFLKFHQRRSAFGPNTLLPGYRRLQHGLLLCAAALCKLYRGIKQNARGSCVRRLRS